MELATESAIFIMSAIFLLGLGVGMVTSVYVVRDYFRKAKAAGKVPVWGKD